MGGGLKAPGYGAAADGEGGVRPACTVQGMKTKESLIPAWKEFNINSIQTSNDTRPWGGKLSTPKRGVSFAG